MYTIPSRLARTAQVSLNPQHARSRVIATYREWLQASQPIIDLYALDINKEEFRRAIRARFERNRHVTDIRAVDVLLRKSRIELQEMLNFWKQKDHILSFLSKSSEVLSRKTFMEKFIEGRDEEAVRPAASGVY